MKMIRLLTVITLILVGPMSAMGIQRPRQPYLSRMVRFVPGYITFNELQGGYGQGVTSVPYSRTLLGFTTVHGYLINNNFSIGGGTGVSVYNGGMLIPLFLDVRYFHYNYRRLVPYFFSKSGFLLDINDLDKGMRLFLNAGPGISYIASNRVSISLGAGLLVQMGEKNRDTFINLKFGLSYRINNSLYAYPQRRRI